MTVFNALTCWASQTQPNLRVLVCINIKINPALQTAGGRTLFVYDEQGQLIGEYDQTGTPIQETIYLGNLPVAVVKNNVVYRLYADHLNTPRAIADTTNKVVWRWNSDAFGTTAANEDPDGDGVKLTYNLRFPGQYLDQETGLHYNYFRDYDPSTGRYSQSDPIGLDGGLNTYTYVYNNPMNYADPYGLFGWADMPTLPQGVVDATTGFGDGVYEVITFGFGDLQDIRDEAGIDGGINKCSTEYSWSNNAGYGWGFGLGGAGLARTFGWTLSFDRYANAGGGGINILRDGVRKFGLDWHRFKLNGQMVNRPHYHNGPTKSQMKKHRPWQGGR